MGVTQYTGARYVPLFPNPADWTNERTYEPLTIVLHEGNSFTSKQFVPKGIDLANEDYWAETGNFNAQVEAYRREVLQFNGRISENAENIDKYAYPKNNPIYYGADPTGAEDSAEAINECIAANKGGIVIFSPGVYRITNPIDTPQEASDRVSIDFNGAEIICDHDMQYAIGVGYGDSSTSSEAGIERIFLKNGVIKNNATCPVGIKTKPHYKDIAISQMNVMGFMIGIKLGESGNVQPCDAQITDCHIRYDDMTIESHGIEVNSTDNKINNCRVYGFKYAVYLNGSGNYFTNVHCLPKGSPTPTKETLENAAFIFSNVTSYNFFFNCYCDTYGNFIKYANMVSASVDICNCQMYAYRSDFDQTFINAENVTNFIHGIVLNNVISLAGANNNNQTFKAPSGDLRNTFTKSGLIVNNNILRSRDNFAYKYGDLFTLRQKTQNVWQKQIDMTTDKWILLCAIPCHRLQMEVGLTVKIPYFTAVIEELSIVASINANIIHVRRISSTQPANAMQFTYGATIDNESFSYPVVLLYMRRTVQGNVTFPITIECDNYGVTDTPSLRDPFITTTEPTFLLEN